MKLLKILIIISCLIISLAECICANEIYTVKLGNDHKLPVSLAIKEGSNYYISNDILTILNINHMATPYKNVIKLSDTGAEIRCITINEISFINIKDIETNTGCEVDINNFKNEITFWNKIINVSVNDDIIKVDTALPAKYKTFIWNQKIIFDIENSKDSKMIDFPCTNSSQISMVRFGIQSNNISRIVCELNGLTKNTAAISRTASNNVILYNTENIIPAPPIAIEKIILDGEEENFILTLKGGALSKPSISNNINTGEYNIKIQNGTITDTKKSNILNDIYIKAINNNNLIFKSQKLLACDIDTKGNDAILHFYNPLKNKKINNLIVVLDPGHGGKAPGAVYQSFKEKDINFQIANTTKDTLEAAGIQVIMTRNGDYDLSLADRGQIGIDKKADLFISIHCNSSGKENNGTGIETYYHMNSTFSKYFGILFHTNVIKNNSLLNRKVKSDSTLYDSGLGVLRKSDSGNVPSILFEAGFINNSTDRKLLTSNEYQQKIANDFLTAIKDFITATPIDLIK